MTNPPTKPRIYVACLAAYNSGKLHGRWIDADQSAEAIEEEAKAMLLDSPIEDGEEWAIEWAIHDYEGFEGIEIDEWDDFEEVAILAQGIKKYGEAFAVYFNFRGADAQGALDNFEEDFIGEYDKASDYVYEMANECGDLDKIPNYLKYAIDWESVARDCECNGDFHFEDGFIFRNN